MSFETTLLSEPQTNGKFSTINITLPAKLPPQSVQVILPRETNISYGQKILLSGTLQEKVLKNKKTTPTMYFPKIEASKHHDNLLLSQVSYLRQKIANVYQLIPSDTESSLLLGIVFGIKKNMPNHFSKNLQQVGLVHVIAASGMNVTMVAGFFMAIFAKFFKRQIAVIVSILGLCFYVTLAGFEPSIIRAVLMSLFAFSAQLIGRQYSGAYILLTHPHADHLNGLVEVLHRYHVEQFATEPLENTIAGFSSLRQELRKANIPVHHVTAGDSFGIGDTTLFFVGPTKNFLQVTSPNGMIGESKEFGSLLTVISYKNFLGLLTGDSQSDEIHESLQQFSISQLSLLQIPHHGSQTGLDKEILQIIQPGMGIISVGKHNRYNHPHRLTLRLLDELQIPIKRTDKDGDIEVVSDGEKWWGFNKDYL